MLNITEKIELQGMPFDKAEMTADNQKELAKFLAALRKATKARGPVSFGAVVVTGHTDRIGSLKYNMGLSERRAVVVKDHLVKVENVDQKIIFWEGKGPKEPIPVTKFCDNKMKRKQLIECLSPNRRVTVEIVGRAQSLAKPKPAAKPKAKPAAKAKPKR
jgi:OOP family OmpA-OmpF porin